MRLPITLTFDNGTTATIMAGPLAIMRWERRYKTKVSRWATDGIGAEDLLYLAWEGLRIGGAPTPASFEEWAATVYEITNGETEDADPFPPAPTATS